VQKREGRTPSLSYFEETPASIGTKLARNAYSGICFFAKSLEISGFSVPVVAL
jgi:hypothetical protein